MVQAPCRTGLTGQDLTFIVRTLTSFPGDAAALERLLADPGSLDVVLDDGALHDALRDGTGLLDISPQLYFYISARHALRRQGVEGREVCDYVAGMLAAFTPRAYLEKTSAPAGARSFGYLSDMMTAIERAPAPQVFALQRFLADYALFLGGVFEDRVTAQEGRRGAPGVPFYEAVGRGAYRAAAARPEAARQHARRLLEELAEAFREIRRALHEMSDRVLHWSPA